MDPKNTVVKLISLIAFAAAALCASCAWQKPETAAADAPAPAHNFAGFKRGMGIGGWLTNYKRFNVLLEKWRTTLTVGDFEHFNTYITEADIKYIASLGLDHVRVGFDQIVVEKSRGVYREEIFALLDNFVKWCRKYDLQIIFNMHKAVGNYADIKEDVELLDSRELQDRFIDVWLAFEDRYANDNAIVFELLNEVRNVGAQKWNDLAGRAVKAIRAKNKTRRIIIGSVSWNSPNRLKDLRLYDDPNIGYTFHMYAPSEFTHQRGVLQAPQLFYNRAIKYPSSMDRLIEFRKCVGAKWDDYKKYSRFDIQFLRDRLAGAFEFAKKHPDKFLWNGEFGTIRHADITSRENYTADIVKLMREHRIPYCFWNYLSTPNDGNRFSLVDDDTRKVLSPRLESIIRGQ